MKLDSTKIQKMQQIQFAYDTMTAGHTYGKTLEMIMDKYSLPKSSAARVITAMYKTFKAETDAEIISRRSEYLTKYLRLYEKLYAKGRYAEAKKVLDSMTKLEGLLIDKIENKQVDEFTLDFK